MGIARKSRTGLSLWVAFVAFVVSHVATNSSFKFAIERSRDAVKIEAGVDYQNIRGIVGIVIPDVGQTRFRLRFSSFIHQAGRSADPIVQ